MKSILENEKRNLYIFEYLFANIIQFNCLHYIKNHLFYCQFSTM